MSDVVEPASSGESVTGTALATAARRATRFVTGRKCIFVGCKEMDAILQFVPCWLCGRADLNRTF